MLRFFRLRPTLAPPLLLGLAAAFLLPTSWSVVARVLVGWNVAIPTFITLSVVLMMRTDVSELRDHAEALDGGRVWLLFVTLAAAAASVAAIVLELISARGAANGGWPIALAVATIASSWALTHLMFAFHYAHEYYAPDDGGPPSGLKFPGDAEPTYGDFAHFSFVIGCASQTADVTITSPTLRRVVTAHCIAAFVFNTAILALTINIAAGLISN